MSEFKPGDVVRLKSSGPFMTVRTIGNDGSGEELVFCDWFVGNESKSEHFPPTSLEKKPQRSSIGVGRGGSGGSWMA